MRDILFAAALLACPLGMLAMGAFAWAAGKLRRPRDGEATTPPTGGAEQPG